jgi:hypothetical protein
MTTPPGRSKRWKISICCWESVASTAERVITTAHLWPKAGIFWRKPSVEDRVWKGLAAGDADQESSILIPAVRSVRSERARKTGGLFIVASAPSCPVTGSELSKATAEFTTAMYWPILRN